MSIGILTIAPVVVARRMEQVEEEEKKSENTLTERLTATKVQAEVVALAK